MIDGIRAVYVHSPGSRTLHAKGAYYEATFTATEAASALTRAAHMGGSPVRSTVRLSNGSGDAHSADYDDDVRGLATSFHLPDGSRTDILAQTTPRAAIGTPDEFLELVRAGRTGLTRATLVPWYLVRHPRSLSAMAEGLPTIRPPASFATTRYYPLHAFRWIAADGSDRWVRMTWIPEKEEPALKRYEARSRGADYLRPEINDRLGRGPVRFTLEVQIAGPGDAPHDPTARWAKDGERVTVGALEITGEAPDGAPGGEPFVFDPMRLTDGIEPSDDPILRYRPGAYSESVERRAAEVAPS